MRCEAGCSTFSFCYGISSCRKAVATAFSSTNMKAEFPNIRLACSQLILVLKAVGPSEVVDMDKALCRESLDVIGECLSALLSWFSQAVVLSCIDEG